MTLDMPEIVYVLLNLDASRHTRAAHLDHRRKDEIMDFDAGFQKFNSHRYSGSAFKGLRIRLRLQAAGPRT